MAHIFMVFGKLFPDWRGSLYVNPIIHSDGKLFFHPSQLSKISIMTYHLIILSNSLWFPSSWIGKPGCICTSLGRPTQPIRSRSDCLPSGRRWQSVGECVIRGFIASFASVQQPQTDLCPIRLSWLLVSDIRTTYYLSVYSVGAKKQIFQPFINETIHSLGVVLTPSWEPSSVTMKKWTSALLDRIVRRGGTKSKRSGFFGHSSALR